MPRLAGSCSVEDRGGFDLDQVGGDVQGRYSHQRGRRRRCVHPTVPPRVEYTRTEPGRALRATVAGMCDWTHRYLGHIETARHRLDT